MAETKEAIDSYLATLDATRRGALSDLRQQIHELVPGLEECISYGLPGFRLQSKMIAGFGAFKVPSSLMLQTGAPSRPSRRSDKAASIPRVFLQNRAPSTPFHG